MKYSILLLSLLSVSSLFGFGFSSLFGNEPAQTKVATISTLQEKETAAHEKNRAELERTRTELAHVKQEAQIAKEEHTLKENKKVHISVIGQGVAPMNTSSPAQAYALAKRAAIADAYRAIAEKIKGVHIDGQDTIKNMMIQRSTVRTQVEAMVRNANIVETTFKEGLCEVEMEIVISHGDFVL